MAITLLTKASRNKADLVLAAFLLTQGFASLYMVFLWGPAFEAATFNLLSPLHNLPLALAYALQGPCLLWYSHTMARQRMALSRADKAVIGCYVFVVCGHAYMYMGHSEETIYQLAGLFDAFPPLLVSIYFGVRALRVLGAYNSQIRQYYSNIDDISLLWLTYSAFGFVGIWILRSISYLSYHALGAEVSSFIGTLSHVPLILLVSWMIILGLNHRHHPDERSSDSGGGSSAGGKDRFGNPQSVARLEDLMVRVKVYQDPELNLEGLADSMGISPRSLSALINGHYQQNFYDFVNHYRISEARQQLSDPLCGVKSIQRIYEDVGFRSKSTFNTMFKKVTGETPSGFRNSAGVCRALRSGKAAAPEHAP